MQARRRTSKSLEDSGREVLFTRAENEVIVFEISRSKNGIDLYGNAVCAAYSVASRLSNKTRPCIWHTSIARARNSGTAQVAPEQWKEPHRHSKIFFSRSKLLASSTVYVRVPRSLGEPNWYGRQVG